MTRQQLLGYFSQLILPVLLGLVVTSRRPPHRPSRSRRRTGCAAASAAGVNSS